MKSPRDRAWDASRVPQSYRNPDPSAEENLKHDFNVDPMRVMHMWYRHLPKEEQEAHGPDHIAAYKKMQKDADLDFEAERK